MYIVRKVVRKGVNPLAHRKKYHRVLPHYPTHDLADQHAISLLHTFYTDLPEEEKAIFVTALIGEVVINYKIAQQIA